MFVCFVTKAVHLEPASDQSTGTFVAVLNRFVSRRNMPRDLHSDNGGNFIGARNDLEKLYKLLGTETLPQEIQTYLVDHGERLCSWKWRKAGRIGTEEAVRVYLIRFIADLPLRLVYRMHDGVPLQLRKEGKQAITHPSRISMSHDRTSKHPKMSPLCLNEHTGLLNGEHLS